MKQQTAYAQVSLTQTPQTEPIPGSNQVANNGGGFGWETSAEHQLLRFLILGSEGNSYYVSSKELTKDNAVNVLKIMQGPHGEKAVQTIVDVSDSGRAFKNEPAIFALAIAAKLGTKETKQAAWRALSKVCRIPTHLYSFCTYVKKLGGWSRGTRKAVEYWFNMKTPSNLAFQLSKYGNRNGWSVRDVLLVSHTKPKDTVIDAVLAAVTGNAEVTEDGFQIKHKEVRNYKVTKPGDTEEMEKARAYLHACEQVKTVSQSEMLKLIEAYRLPMEVIPTERRDAGVYELMLENYGATALLRNLANLTRHKVIAPGKWDNNAKVIERLTSEKELRAGRIHPLSILVAKRTYAQGKGEKGTNTWVPVGDVVEALEKAFYLSFGTIEPANKIFMLALDVSGSMAWNPMKNLAGMTPREASAVMAMTTFRTETKVLVKAFSTGLMDVPITRDQTLETVTNILSQMPMSGTNCSAPIRYALEEGIKVDTFVIYTDNETNHHGEIHPAQLLKQYRNKVYEGAKLVVCAMERANKTIADPQDAGMMDIVGFDTATPNVITGFARGDF